jgi:hypothetical protein
MDKKKKSKIVSPPTLFERINGFLDKHLARIFWVAITFTLLFGILLFDIRFSFSGDDSAYVIRAYDFIHHFILPGFQGPLYPVVLSPLIAFFGIHPVPLKSLSILFMLGFVYFIYRAFKNRIPSLLLVALLILVSVNSFILYYASQTYSEAFFMFLEALAFFVFFSYFIDDRGEQPFGVRVKHHIILALCILSLGITRSIGFSLLLVAGAYFILQRQWKNLAWSVLSFLFILALYQGFKYVLWGNAGFQFSEQGERLMYKDFYNPSMGREDLLGYVNRLIRNSDFYLSGVFYALLGVRKEQGNPDLYMSLTVLTYLVLVASVILTFRKNKYLLFTGVYVFIFLVNTFIILQASWGQSRLIIPFVPMILLMFLAFLYWLFCYKRLMVFSWTLILIILVLIGVSLRATFVHISFTRQITDRYWGLTPDWENYCKASEWASKNISQDAVIACRKPTISFIYGNGRRFYGINDVKSYSGKALLQYWKEKGSQLYVVSASSLVNKQLPETILNAIRPRIVAFGTNVAYGNASELFRFYVMDFSDSLKEQTFGELNKAHINPVHNIDSLKRYLDNPKETIKVIFPDTLLNILLNAHVTHVLEASLRYKSSQKTGQLINTVERFMIYIGVKYPMILTKLIRIGADNNEPATIYRMNYEPYGLKPSP